MFSFYLKRTLRDKSWIFWSLAFPVALMICFKVAFGNIYNLENSFNPVGCAIVYTDSEDSMLKIFADTCKSQKKYLDVVDTANFDEALELLKTNEIKGIYEVGADKINILFSEKCGETDSMVIRTFADSFLNGYSLSIAAITSGNAADLWKIQEIVNSDMSVVAEKTNLFDTDPDPYKWYFYATLVMAMMFNIEVGITTIGDIQANLTGTAVRTSVSPVKKSRLVLSIVGARYVVANIISGITLVAMRYVFDIIIGTRILLVILFLLLGNLFAITTGMVIGMVMKGSLEQRGNKTMAWVMISVFIGGEMMAQLPGILEQKMPIINDINPATVLNMALYKVTNLNNLSGFYVELSKIAIVSVIMLVIIVVKVRREKYASL